MSSGGDAMTEDLGLEGGDGSGISSSGRCSGEEGSCSGVGEVGRELSGAVEVEEEGENWEDMNRGGNKKESKIPMKLARAARLAGVKKGAEGAEDGTRTETETRWGARRETEAWERPDGGEKSGPSTRKWAALGRGRSGRYDARGLRRAGRQAGRRREETGRGWVQHIEQCGGELERGVCGTGARMGDRQGDREGHARGRGVVSGRRVKTHAHHSHWRPGWAAGAGDDGGGQGDDEDGGGRSGGVGGGQE